MTEPDPSVSNGTCFYAPRKEASSNFIPCGNWVFGHIQCCQVGDKCLSHNACYNNKHGTTYLAGCSRFDYDDPSCPDKKSYEDYPWAGLIYCRPNRWMACEEEAKPKTIRKGDECTCPSASETMTVAFSAPNVLEDVALLPTAHGGTIEWFANFLPTTEAASTTPASTSKTTDFSATTATTTMSSSKSNIPLPTPTKLPESEPHNLSTGAKAGIGLGATFGAILLFGALSALWMVFRRRGNDKNVPSSPETGQAASSQLNEKPPSANPSSGLPEMPTPDVPPRPAYSELPVGPWVVRPELQGDATPYSHGSSPPVSPASSAGWQDYMAQGWGMGNPALPTVVEERRVYQGYQAQEQGPGQWVSVDERSRRGEGVALELPA